MSTYTRHQDTITWEEAYLYGSSRLGSWEPGVQWRTGVTLPAGPYYQSVTKLYEGARRYEITNHLGNVLATLSDRKRGMNTSTSATTATHYDAVVQSATDYYAFGQEMPGRTFTADRYGFGFNGKENDKDWGTQLIQDYGFRLYNPGLGRFLSVDPLFSKYSSWSPYNFTLNRPTTLTDPSGMYPIYGKDGRYLGDDGRSGNGDLAFVGTVMKRDKNGNAIEFGNLAQFTNDHNGFLMATGKIMSESSINADKTENLWIAHTANNASQNLDTKVGEGVIEKFNQTSYSTTSNSKVKLRDNSSKANFARAGLIDVLTGGADPTGCATHWDGQDFLRKGLAQNKFKEYGEVLIHGDHLIEFINAQRRTYNTVVCGDFNFECIEGAKGTNGTWGWRNNNSMFYVKQLSLNKAYYNLELVATKGSTIFWKATKIKQ